MLDNLEKFGLGAVHRLQTNMKKACCEKFFVHMSLNILCATFFSNVCQELPKKLRYRLRPSLRLTTSCTCRVMCQGLW